MNVQVGCKALRLCVWPLFAAAPGNSSFQATPGSNGKRQWYENLCGSDAKTDTQVVCLAALCRGARELVVPSNPR